MTDQPSQSSAAGAEPGAPSAREVELKLAVPSDQLAQLRRHPLVIERSVGRAASRTLRSVYYDTMSLSLASQGSL